MKGKRLPIDRQEKEPLLVEESSSDSDCWDRDRLEQLTAWKEPQKPKPPRRLQDISCTIESDKEVPEMVSESWPYESSPCALYGGKNTKKGKEHSINKDLFDSDFVNHKHGIEFEEGDISLVAEEKEELASYIPKKQRPSKANAKPSQTKVQTRGQTDSEEIPGHSLNRSSRPSHPETFDTPDTQPTSDDSSDSDLPRHSQLRSRKCERKGSMRQGGKKSKSKENEAISTVTPSVTDGSKTSGTAEAKVRRPRRGERTNDGDALSSGTYHGPETVSGPVSYSRACPSRKAPPRTKSSDGMDRFDKAPGEELGAASLHGSCSVSRIRGSRKAGGERKPKSDRRGQLTRAMSTTNVKRPEEYGPRGNLDSSLHDVERRKATGRQRMKMHRSASQQSLNSSQSSINASQSSLNSSQSSLESSVLNDSQATFASFTGPTKTETDRFLGPTSDDENSDDDIKVEEQLDEQQKFANESSPRQRIRRSKSTGTAGPAQRRRERNTEPRRDLLVLLREQQKVQQSDLMDKENRRLLHFLVYEHKMGVSIKELARSVRQDQQAEVESPIRRRRISLEV